MNYRYTRRSPKWKVTGRFYTIMTVLLVGIVVLCVKLNMPRDLQPKTAGADVDVPTAYTEPVQQQAEEEVPVVPASPQDTSGGTTMTFDPNTASLTSEMTGGDVQDPGTQIGEGIEVLPPPQGDQGVITKMGANMDLPNEWTNILLLGSDSRDMSKINNTRCDTIIVVSISGKTGQMKMMSILRDTMVEVPGKGMRKINSVPEVGGVEMMINVINENLGLNITNYAMVNFAGMVQIIDILDGVFVSITKAEAEEINRHVGDVAQYTTMSREEYLAQRDSMKITKWGDGCRLNGIQAVTYSRIRSLDSDYERTRRQKKVLNAMMDRVRGAGLPQLGQIGLAVIGNMKTNIQVVNAALYAKSVLDCELTEGKVMDWQIPKHGETATYEKRNGTEAFYDVNYEEIRKRVYKYIYET